jgi:phosphoserine aminotransferase
MMTRKHNFNLGPAVLPLEELEQAKQDLMEYRSKWMSFEGQAGHRSLGGLRASCRLPLARRWWTSCRIFNGGTGKKGA